MATFNTAAEFNGWDQKEKLAYLRTSLTGTAVQLLWEADDIAYTQLVARLKEQFGSIGIQERYQTELRCRRRKEGESIRELAQPIRGLMSQAYQGESDSRLGQHIARDSFLSALNDPELQFEVRKCDPHTVEETVKLASRIEISRAAVEQPAPTRHRVNRRVEEQPPATQQSSREPDYERRAVPRLEPSHRPDSAAKYSHQIGTQASQPRSPRKLERRSRAMSSSESQHIEEMVREMQAMKISMMAMSKKLEQYENADRLGPPNVTPRPPLPSPAPRPEQQPRASQENVREPNAPSFVQPPTVLCWSCGEPGHYSRQCPSGRRYQQPAQQSGQRQMDPNRNYRPAPPGPQLSSQNGQSPQEYRASGVRKSRVCASVGESSGSATYLKARVYDKELDCLLGTGSEVSLIPASLVLKSEIRPTDYTLRAASGTRIEVLGCAVIPITTDVYSSAVDGVVTNHVTELMLGADWPSENFAQWNFVDSTVSLGGNVHKLSAVESSYRSQSPFRLGHSRTSSAA